MAVAVKHVTDPVPNILSMVPSLPIEVDGVIKLSMAKNRDQRYSTALEMAKALNLVAFGREGNTKPVTGGATLLQQKTAAQPSRSKTGFTMVGAVLLVVIVGVFLLRNQLFASPQATPTLEVVPTTTTVKTPTEEATLTAVPATATIDPASLLAPACSAEIGIPTPIVRETNKACVMKIPYTSVSIPEGAAFESINPSLKCAIETTSDGKSIVACTGRQLYSYDLKVCVPPVVANEDLNKCSADSVFLSANQCCAPIPADGAGCTIFKVDLRACQ